MAQTIEIDGTKFIVTHPIGTRIEWTDRAGSVRRGRVAGLATAELLSPDSAEVAFLVADQDRGRGLGSLLLEHLAALGRRHGVSRFEAEVLGDNYGMLRVFRAAGFAATRKTVAGEVEVELRTDASREAVESADRREWRAAARSSSGRRGRRSCQGTVPSLDARSLHNARC